MAEAKKVLLINSHLTYPNWTEGTLNNAFYQAAKDFFTSTSIEVLETTIEDGYNSQEEVQKHLEADIVILQMPVNWFGAPWRAITVLIFSEEVTLPKTLKTILHI